MNVEFAACRVDITPSEPQPLFGYASRPGLSRGVAEPLEANILSLAWGNERLHLVATDSLYGGAVAGKIAVGLGADDRVFGFGSHTHFAPGCDPGLPTLGETRAGYMDTVSRQVLAGIRLQRFHGPVGFGVATRDAPGLFINRRRPAVVRLPRLGKTLMAPNPKAGVDPTIRVAGVLCEGVLEAVIWGASCHPVSSPRRELISSCYPGVVRRIVREYLGMPDLPVLFVQGFSGDIRPHSVSHQLPRSAKGVLMQLLAGGIRFVDQDPSAYDDWCRRLARQVCDALDEMRVSSPQPGSVRVSEGVQHPDGWTRAARLTEIRLSQGVRLVIANAEVVHERVSDLDRWPGLTIPVGCADEVIGYWPTDQMVREGGYEGCLSRKHFPALDWGTVGGPDRLWRSLLDSL